MQSGGRSAGLHGLTGLNPAAAKILVIRGGAIGDFILTLPVFRALREHFPQVLIEVLGYPHIASLALAGGLVDNVRSIEARALAGFFGRVSPLQRELAEYFAGFALIISYLYDPDEVFKTNLSHCFKGQFVVGPHRPDESQRVPASEAFLKPLERLAIFSADPVPRLPVVADSTLGFPAGRWLGVHPGSGSEHKNWPEACWLELLQDLVRTTDWQFLMVGGEAEADRLRRLTNALPPTRCRLLQHLPLPELAAMLKHCWAFIGHDSGISHLAAAVGLPGLALWGESNEVVWRPPSPSFSVLRDPYGLSALPVARVLSEVRSLMPGSPGEA